MARPMARLKAIEIDRLAKRKGNWPDGGGLYLCASPPNGCSWLFRYRSNGKTRWMGLGGYPTISLADARARAADARRLRVDGLDPIAARDTKRAAARLEAAKATTFRQCAQAYIDSQQQHT